MGISKTEVNLKRLLAAAPRQQNQAKLVHYVATLRELLEQLDAETTSEGVTSISKAKLNDYSKKIEALAAQLTAPLLGPVEAVDNKTSLEKEPSQNEQAAVTIDSTQGLRRRIIHHSGPAERTHEIKENDPLTPVRLDDAAQARIERHRKLQDDLTDEMVVLAQQLKESSLMMNRSLQETEKASRNRSSSSLPTTCAGVAEEDNRRGEGYCRRPPEHLVTTAADPPDPLRCQRDPPAAVAVLPSSLRVGLRQCDDVPCRIQCRCGRVKGLRREISDDLAGVGHRILGGGVGGDNS